MTPRFYLRGGGLDTLAWVSTVTNSGALTKVGHLTEGIFAGYWRVRLLSHTRELGTLHCTFIFHENGVTDQSTSIIFRHNEISVSLHLEPGSQRDPE